MTDDALFLCDVCGEEFDPVFGQCRNVWHKQHSPVHVILSVPPVTLRPKRRAHCVAITESQVTFQRLTVPDACAKSFVIHDISIDNAGQFATPGTEIPAACFAPTAIGVSMSMDRAPAGSIVDIVFENTTAEDQTLVFALMGIAPKGHVFSPSPPADEQRYHAWVKRRQEIYEKLHRGEGEDCFFNGQEILSDTFAPKTDLWWVDADGYPGRPCYTFEKVALGDTRGGLQVVNIKTYEGFEGT